MIENSCFCSHTIKIQIPPKGSAAVNRVTCKCGAIWELKRRQLGAGAPHLRLARTGYNPLELNVDQGDGTTEVVTVPPMTDVPEPTAARRA